MELYCFAALMRKIRKHIILSLLLVVLLGSMRFPIVYMEFALNKDYITNVLCINREKPITVCGGSCYLKKRLEKEQSKKATTERSGKRVALALYFESIKEIFIPKKPCNQLYEKPGAIYAFTYCKGVFHPPNA